MPHPLLIALPDRAVLRLSGVDIEPFLQGIITADARKIAPGAVVYSALLSPQGKMLADFFLHPAGTDVLLEVEAGRVADLQARLKMYKLRAKVTITNESALWHSVVSLGEIALPHGTIGGPDPRVAGFSTRLLLMEAPATWAAAQGLALGSLKAYDRARIERFLPDGMRDYTPERSFPLELGLDYLGAIDFQKGCYVGQEATNTQKRRLARRKALGRVESTATLPEPGEAILVEGTEIGTMRSSCGKMGLALLRIEEVSQRTMPSMHIVMPEWVAALEK